MKTCPYCERKLEKSKEYKGHYYCQQYNDNEFDHSYIDDNGYLDFDMVRENENPSHLWFSNEKYLSLFVNLNDSRAILKDFNDLKGKSFKELLDIYNKLKVFS